MRCSRISETGGLRVDAGEFLIVAEHHGNVVLSAEREKALVTKALVTRLDRVAKRDPVDLARKGAQEAGDIVFVELAAGGQHPQDRAELIAQCRESLSEIGGDAFTGIGEFRPGYAEARAFDRELKAVRHRPGPIGPAFWTLAAVKSRIDFDRTELVRRIFEFALLRQVGWIEGPTPRRKGPSADPDSDEPARHQAEMQRMGSRFRRLGPGTG
jgi:hypothetical protein